MCDIHISIPEFLIGGIVIITGIVAILAFAWVAGLVGDYFLGIDR